MQDTQDSFLIVYVWVAACAAENAVKYATQIIIHATNANAIMIPFVTINSFY